MDNPYIGRRLRLFMIHSLEQNIGEEQISSDVLSWITQNSGNLFNDPRILENKFLLRDIKTIFSHAFHTNFPADYDCKPDGLELSKLNKYGEEVKIRVVSTLKEANDTCGYIRRYIGEFLTAA